MNMVVNALASNFQRVARIAATMGIVSRAPRLATSAGCVCSALLLTQCSSTKFNGATPRQPTNVVVSVAQQKLALYDKSGSVGKAYPVSTSKFGLGDKPGTNSTPLGLHEVVAKIGHGVKSGSVFKSRQLTGEVIKPNAPGRDPIVSRIMWLKGLEPQNSHAYSRCIYIHGTAAENQIGKPVSYGCIRMKSMDVIDLFGRMGIGSKVLIVQGNLPKEVNIPSMAPPPSSPASAPPIFLNPEQQPMKAPPSKPQPIPMPMPPPQENYQPLQPVILAQNNQIPSEAVSTENGAFRSRKLDNGSVVYTPHESAPTTGGAPIVLKSRRHASQEIR